MISTIFKIQCYKLWNRPTELAMILVVPLIFFSIFAAIFGSRERSVAGNKIKVAILHHAPIRIFAGDSEGNSNSLYSIKIFHGLAKTEIANPVKPEEAIDWVNVDW